MKCYHPAQKDMVNGSKCHDIADCKSQRLLSQGLKSAIIVSHNYILAQLKISL